jgi:hypothetical protein
VLDLIAPSPDFDVEQARGLRQPRDVRAVGKQTVSGGRSWWELKTRAELNAEAQRRAEAMSKSDVGRSVKGQVNTP